MTPADGIEAGDGAREGDAEGRAVPNEPAADRFRVATYNVRYSGLDGGALAWDARRDGVAATIRAIAPDAVALQECWLGQLDDLRERLPGYGWAGVPDAAGEHTPVGYRTDRVALEAVDAFGVAPGGERGVAAWDADLPRTVTRATLRVPGVERAVPVFSVHLDHRGSEARLEGARLVVDRLPDGPVVVAGDCNCEPGSAPYRVLAAELDDARAVAADRSGPAATYVGFGGRAAGESDAPEPRRIDHVFVRGFDVAAYRVVGSGDVGVSLDGDADVPPGDGANPSASDGADLPPSDHRPVVVDLVARRGDGS